MKYIKNICLSCLLFLVILFITGCTTPTDKPSEKVDKTIDEVKTEVLNALGAYEKAEHGKFKSTVKNGDKQNTVEITFNYDMLKTGILSLAATIQNEQGTMSLYVDEDSKVYTNRYNQSKTVSTLTDSQGEAIANEYGFSQFNEYIILMLNNSFFANAEVKSFKDNVAKVELNIGQYNIDNEEENETLTTIFDGIKESDSVVLEVTYNEGNVSNLKITIEKGTTSVISLDLLGTSTSDIAIEYPDFTGYVEAE